MSAKIIQVPYIDQTIKYPTGCESISAVMLLNYLGCDITPENFINHFLPKSEFEFHDGILYGPDPADYFMGSTYNNEEGSYGCYPPAIIKALSTIVEGRYKINDETGTPISELLTRYIDNDMPVIFWATLNMEPTSIGKHWKLIPTFEKDNSPSSSFDEKCSEDEDCEKRKAEHATDKASAFEAVSRFSAVPNTPGLFTWMNREHCLLLVGYDDDKLYFNDPWENHGCTAYDRTLVEKRHAEQFEGAVGLTQI